MFNDSSHSMQAAAEGQGVALARGSLLGNDVHNGNPVRLFDIVAPVPRKFWLAYFQRAGRRRQAPKWRFLTGPTR